MTRPDSASPAEPSALSGRTRIVNLTFHGLGEPPRALQPGERGVWLSVEQFTAILDRIITRPEVRLSFDDGNVSDLLYALPNLVDRGAQATFFLVVDFVGRPGFLDRDGIAELVGAGMSIGLHGLSHRSWRSADDDELGDELVTARARLEEIAGQPIVDASCPFGAYDRRVLRRLRHERFAHVFTSDGGCSRHGDWLQARTSLGPADDASCVERILEHDSSLLRRSLDDGKRLVKRWR
jgi:peptidoglycan/xylan/chitin deacetylase (PgdA/CDA1 family)